MTQIEIAYLIYQLEPESALYKRVIEAVPLEEWCKFSKYELIDEVLKYEGIIGYTSFIVDLIQTAFAIED